MPSADNSPSQPPAALPPGVDSTLLIVDEGWLALDDEGFAGQLREWLKTLRKKNASVVFATQSLSDIDGSAIAPAIIESFAAHLMLLFDRWKHEGADAVARAFAGRLEGGGAIGDAGDLIREGGHEALGPALARAPLWRDATGPIL